MSNEHVMNVFDDVRRRIFFMSRELVMQGTNPDVYGLVMSRTLHQLACRDMSNDMHATHLHTPDRLLGFPLTLTDRPDHYLALVHEVRG